MTAIIRQIQRSLEHGRPLDIKTGPLAAKVLKEIQKTNTDYRKNDLVTIAT